MDVEERVRGGMPEGEARRQAMLRLGGLDATKERWRDRWGFPVLQELKQDLKGAARALGRYPGFRRRDGLDARARHRRLDGDLHDRARRPDRAAAFSRFGPARGPLGGERDRPGRRNVVAPANFIRWSERATAFSSMTALFDTRVSLTGRPRPEELIAQNVTSNFFGTLGVAPILGRGFAPDEGPDGHDAVAVLSHGAWRRFFGGDPAIVGRTILVNGRPVEVIGVAPLDFGFFLKAGSLVGKPPDIWLPFTFSANSREPKGRYISAFARLREGVSFSEASAQMRAIAASLSEELPRFDKYWTANVFPIRDEVSGDMKPALRVLAGAVGFVLLIVCVNVANLLLARGWPADRRWRSGPRSAPGGPVSSASSSRRTSFSRDWAASRAGGSPGPLSGCSSREARSTRPFSRA
jgi:hypothetical protein